MPQRAQRSPPRVGEGTSPETDKCLVLALSFFKKEPINTMDIVYSSEKIMTTCVHSVDNGYAEICGETLMNLSVNLTLMNVYIYITNISIH